ncbi:hypothetical protein QCA50_005977 [Cerrena zonata]|uniref:Terpene synthase n=1 Tax=Cerrena zonata TaxID=2478898 RepID=A0AAW0GI22_9APHY
MCRNADEWILNEVSYNEEKRARFFKINGGLLAGYCFPDTDAFHLQVASDFIEWIFVVDDLTDEYTKSEVGSLRDIVMTCFRDPEACDQTIPVCRLATNLFTRFLQTAGPRCTKRFVDTMELYVDAVIQQAADRDSNNIPDMQTYIALRRETSAVRPSIILAEFTAGIDLPDGVAEHPLIRSMEDATNDWCSWTNDIFSYNKEQSVGDTHNFVAVIMKERNLDLQAAMDYAGELCLACITTFEDNRKALPSWGGDIDRQVNLYIQGMQDWIIGSLHWSFDCKRYFGTEGDAIKQHRVIQLAPQRKRVSAARNTIWYVTQQKSGDKIHIIFADLYAT